MKNWLCALLLLLSAKTQAQLSDFGNVDFKRADSVAALYKGEGLSHLPLLANKLTASLETEVEQFRAIYTWVCTNIESDYFLSEKIDNKREKFRDDSEAISGWSNFFRTAVFEKLLKERKTVCTGYAYLVRELATFAGINCEIVDGYGRSANSNVNELSVPNHSWNAVQLNGKWYLCDATWSSGYHEIGKIINFVFDYNDSYFLAPPQFFVLNHYPLDTSRMLMLHKPDVNEFVNGPLVYDQAFEHHIFPVEPKTMNLQFAKNESITFSLVAEAPEQAKNIFLELEGAFNARIIKPDTIRNNGLIEFKCKVEKSGYYDAHVKCDKDVVATYTVLIKR